MDTNFSPIENYPFLSPFIFTEDPQKLEKHKKALLKKLIKAWKPLHLETARLRNILLHVKKFLQLLLQNIMKSSIK